MSYCPKCGAELSPDSQFCPSCGTPVNQKSAPRASEASGPDCNKWFGVLAYLGPVVFVPMFVKKHSKFAQFHVHQGFNLFVFWVATVLVECTIGYIPYVGTYFFRPLMYIAQVGLLVFSIIGIVHALRGEMKPLPLFGDKIDLLKTLFKM